MAEKFLTLCLFILSSGFGSPTLSQLKFRLELNFHSMLKFDTPNRVFFISICPPLGWLPVLGPREQFMTPALDAALIISSSAGADLGRTSEEMSSRTQACLISALHF